MKITYYLELVSSWCHWAEPAWTELKTRYSGRAEFEWKIALMDGSGLPVSREQCDWFYRRSGGVVRSPYMLHSGWFDPSLKEYLAPNLVAEAAKDMGICDDRARLAITHAALREGRRVGDWNEAVAVAAAATGLDAAQLLARAQSPEIAARARATTAEFHAMQATQRPTFVIESAIGDRVMLSGLVNAAPMIAVIESMLSDVGAYASHRAHHGTPPPA